MSHQNIDSDEDNRSSFRRRTLKAGQIVFHEQSSAVDCMVRNLSENGCQVVLSNQAGVPSKFELHMPMSGERFECEVIWRKLNKIGIKFTSLHGI